MQTKNKNNEKWIIVAYTTNGKIFSVSNPTTMQLAKVWAWQANTHMNKAGVTLHCKAEPFVDQKAENYLSKDA